MNDCPFEVLKVKREDSKEIVKSQYRKLLVEYHPDRQTDPILKKANHEKFVQITNAYDQIMNNSITPSTTSKNHSYPSDSHRYNGPSHDHYEFNHQRYPPSKGRHYGPNSFVALLVLGVGLGIGTLIFQTRLHKIQQQNTRKFGFRSVKE
ncbi:hypothetical protein BC833DRAFT_591904 [Globomyces pollinis-pini]|nr:hypothetical protein BC833DRAFT_591904 [Globomyces pollinis-pini]